MTRTAIPAAAAACAALIAAGCGGGAPQVSEHDARAVYGAVEGDAQFVAVQDCGSVRRPVSDGTRRAVEVTLGVARKNPGAMLPSRDFAGLEWRMSDYVADWARTIEFCLQAGREVHPSWRTLERDMDRAVADMHR
jgi:hypothetical protein